MDIESPIKLLRQVEIQQEEAERLPEWVRRSIEMQTLQGLGLCQLPEGRPPKLTPAGRQYLERDGKVSVGVLQYLPGYLDNLLGREAMIEAGARVAQAYGQAVSMGEDELYTRKLMPRAFAPAVGPELSARMYAATIAAITRLLDQQPPGCVAEEIATARIMEEAARIIQGQQENQGVEREEAEEAIDSLSGIFALLGDAEVLNLFEMEEPSDAALLVQQGEDQVDQRLEAWFTPLWGKAASGHLGELSEWEFEQ